MQKMTVEQRTAHIAKMTAERTSIQKQIVKATLEREKHIAKIQKENPTDDGNTLGDAIVDAVRVQLKQNGFQQKKK